MIFLGDIMLYLFIFVMKIIENMIATLRLIVVSNGKKGLGSILLFLTSIIWIVSSSITIININIIGVLVFSIGSLIGSYVGSLLEEKIALGTCLTIVISSKKIDDLLRNNGYIVTSLNGDGINGLKYIMFIVIDRKKLNELRKNILLYDKNSIILKEYVTI